MGKCFCRYLLGEGICVDINMWESVLYRYLLWEGICVDINMWESVLCRYLLWEVFVLISTCGKVFV